jgi:hypothetical protein
MGFLWSKTEISIEKLTRILVPMRVTYLRMAMRKFSKILRPALNFLCALRPAPPPPQFGWGQGGSCPGMLHVQCINKGVIRIKTVLYIFYTKIEKYL